MAFLLSENARVDVSGIVLPQNWKPPCSGTPVDWPGPKTTRRDRNESRRDRQEIASRLRSNGMLPSPMGRRPKSALSPMTTMRKCELRGGVGERKGGKEERKRERKRERKKERKKERRKLSTNSHNSTASSFAGGSTMTSTTRTMATTITSTQGRPKTSSATPGSRRRRREQQQQQERSEEEYIQATVETKTMDATARSPGAYMDVNNSEMQETPLPPRPWSPASRSSTVLEPLLGTIRRRKGRPPMSASTTFGSTATAASTLAMIKSQSKETLRQRRTGLSQSPARARAIESCVSTLSRSAAQLKLAHAATSSGRPKTATSSTLASVRRWAPAMSASRVSLSGRHGAEFRGDVVSLPFPLFSCVLRCAALLDSTLLCTLLSHHDRRHPVLSQPTPPPPSPPKDHDPTKDRILSRPRR